MQARAIARRMRKLIPAHEPVEVWASDLRRAATTADAVADALHVRPVLLPA